MPGLQDPYVKPLSTRRLLHWFVGYISVFVRNSATQSMLWSAFFTLHRIRLFEERSVLAYPTTADTGHSLLWTSATWVLMAKGPSSREGGSIERGDTNKGHALYCPDARRYPLRSFFTSAISSIRLIWSRSLSKQTPGDEFTCCSRIVARRFRWAAA